MPIAAAAAARYKCPLNDSPPLAARNAARCRPMLAAAAAGRRQLSNHQVGRISGLFLSLRAAVDLPEDDAIA